MNNSPNLWIEHFPKPTDSDHKYTRGQVAVLGGPEMTGAACLAAHAASRIGAGLVMIVSPRFDFPPKPDSFDPMPIYHAFMPHLVVREGMSFLDYIRQSERKGLCVPVIGPGLGSDYAVIRKIVLAALKREKPIVLDADALNAFEGHSQLLINALHPDVILTPHEGELRRFFPQNSKQDRAAAVDEIISKMPAVLVLKGPQTLIAQKSRGVVVNTTSSPYLATAGSGDVLSGMIAGLRAQGMSAFDAACAGVWMHGKAAQLFGPGLIAADLPDLIPKVLQEVLGFQEKVS